MSGYLRIENVLIQVRSKLNDSRIKLWLPPYYMDGIGSLECELERLANDFHDELNIPYEYCLAAITELQSYALDKLKAKDEFAKTGIATLKIRIPNQPGGTDLLTIHRKLSDSIADIQQQIGTKLNIATNKIKLISNGKVLVAGKTLEEEGVTNNQQFMVLILNSTVAESEKENAMYDRVQKIREDTEMLVKAQSRSFIQVEDQCGKAIYLPPKEQKCLLMALALHEKGRAALRRNDYSEALIIFLESDKEYGECNSSLLESVDNYALLNLDIVWCYLCLKSVMQLPDAERRLQICEKSFTRSYGLNLDRVVAIKGHAGNERALVMRLHLLNAVLMFHQNRRSEAQALLRLVESEMQGLRINEHSLNALIEMGYTPIEARTGLRAANGNLDDAINYIISNREKRIAARKKSKDEKSLMKSLRTNNEDDWVNPRTLATLVEMGFDKSLCALALRKCKNDTNLAITMLQEKQEDLYADLNQIGATGNELIDQIVKLGFPREIAKSVLQNSSHSLNEAIDIILGHVNAGTYDSLLGAAVAAAAAASSSGVSPSSSSSSSAQQSTSAAADRVADEQKELEMSAFERFSEDVDTEDDNHLDISLVQEESILSEYKRFLDM